MIKESVKSIRNFLWPKYKYDGQGLEDSVLEKIFKNSPKGTYVDIGSNDPISFNNTYFFYKKGWKGICCEPNKEFNTRYNSIRPNDIILNVAASNFNGTAEFFTGGFNVHSSLRKSGTNETNSENVNTVKLEELLDKYNFPKNFELLSIDTEGSEVDVLEGLNLNKYRPQIILVEYNNAGIYNNSIQPFLINHGYHLIFINTWNFIFSTNLDDAKSIYL